MCRFCKLDTEDPALILLECEAVARKRAECRGKPSTIYRRLTLLESPQNPEPPQGDRFRGCTLSTSRGTVDQV